MNRLMVLTGKETSALFSSPIAYAVMAVFLLLLGYSFSITLFVSKNATLVHVFFQAAMLLVLIVPIITMRQFSEERRSGTLELLLTGPAHEIEVVLAKWLACMAVITLMTGLTFGYAIVLAIYGDPDWGPVYSGYAGLLLLGGALVSIGLALSALTTNQVVAAVVSLGVFGLLWGIDGLAAFATGRTENWILGLSLLGRFTPFATGALYLSDLGFFLVVTLLGMFLCVRALARR
ncbi:MAG: ABC transporter permease subunit [Burkholderiales bacterium]|nr:ABC transporter permease subunit [Burkholderiales bacterium]